MKLRCPSVAIRESGEEPLSHVGKPEQPYSMPLIARCIWLGGPVLVLVLSRLMGTGEQRKVLLPWSGIALPETCHFHRLFGLDCPGCGLTRSFIHISHGELMAAWQLNPLGLVLYTYLALQVPQALLRWWNVEHRRGWLSDNKLASWTRVNEWALIGILLGLVLQWMLRTIGRGIF